MTMTDTGALRIHGHEVEPGNGKTAAAMVASRRRPFQICYCVQDSPDNPCPCMHDRRWWFEEGSIVASGRSERKDEAGKPLQYFDVVEGTSVLVEMDIEDVIREARQPGNAAHR